MNPFVLYRKCVDEKMVPVNAWGCSECGKLLASEEAAKSCCTKYDCSYCGKRVEKSFFMIHDECREMKRLQESIEVEDEGGPLYDEARDRYYENMEYLLDWYEGEDESLPEFVTPCEEVKWKGIDIRDVVANAVEDLFEDALDRVKGLDELEAFVDQWNKSQDIVSWCPDPRKKVRVHQDGHEEEVQDDHSQTDH